MRKLIVAVAQPAGTVYNPATGAGHLMVDAATDDASHVDQLVGQEINARIWAMSQLNLAIHGITADVALGDVFGEDAAIGSLHRLDPHGVFTSPLLGSLLRVRRPRFTG